MDADLNDAFHWAFGRGFWYADPTEELTGLSKEQLYWSPAHDIPCVLWHLGHIGHRECFHIQCMLLGKDQKKVIPRKWGLFFDCPYDSQRFRNAFPEPREIMDWVQDERSHTHQFISRLQLADYDAVPPSSFEGNSIARVLMQTIGHTGLHIGKIQLLQRLMTGADRS